MALAGADFLIGRTAAPHEALRTGRCVWGTSAVPDARRRDGRSGTSDRPCIARSQGIRDDYEPRPGRGLFPGLEKRWIPA